MLTSRKRILAFLTTAATTATTVALLATPAPAHAQSSVLELRPPEELLNTATNFAADPATPEPLKAIVTKIVGFFRGEGEGGVDIPEQAVAPAIAQFAWPTIAGNCIGGTNNATGTALAVPGPADLPLPGVPADHATFIFTALGTGPVSKQQHTAMRVNWVNITTGASGVTPLQYSGINEAGPATVTGTAATGKGTIVALLSGGVTTDIDDGNEPGGETSTRTANCEFAPTSGIFEVR